MLDRTCLAPHAVRRWARETPDAVALEHVAGDRLTYAELDADARLWAAAFARAGIGADDHVATMLPNGFDAHRTLLGLAWLRAVEVPMNTAATGRLLEYALDLADVTTLVVAPEYVDRVTAVADRLPNLTSLIVLASVRPAISGLPTPKQSVSVVGSREELLDGVEPVADGALPGPEYFDVHSLMFTSGTTGPSKAVVTPWPVVYQFWSWVPDDTLAPGDALYCTMPLFHNSGRSAFNFALVRGARFVMREQFSASSFWADVRATRCTTAALVGPMTALLYAAPPQREDAENPLRNVILGPMIPDMEGFERRFDVRVATSYGQTEVGIAVATGWDHGPPANCGRVRTDYPWAEVRVVDERDLPLGPGEVGELVVRSAEPWALNAGYYRMAEQTVDAWRNGWFHTGDAFRYDDDGWYYFVDRLRDTIRRRGENISSFEVETLVTEYPDVRECAAVGVPSPLGEDDVMVAVIVRDAETFDPSALVEFLTQRMPRFMVPRYVEVVDDLPRTEASLRVRKHELRARGVTAATWDREA